MELSRKYCPALLFFISFLSLTCTEKSVEPANQFNLGGEYNITIKAIQHDEFQRIVSFSGTADLQLITTSQTYQGRILEGNSSYLFKRVSSLNFILNARKEGFFPYEGQTTAVYFYPLPSSEMKIDSIKIVDTLSSGIVKFKLVAHKTAPSDGIMNCVVFLGLDSNVNSKADTYFDTFQGYFFQSNTIWLEVNKQDYAIQKGTRVYITARLMTGATKGFFDEQSKKMVFINLENNSNVVSSFTY